MKFSASPVFLFLVRLLVVAALGRSRSLLVEVNVRFALEFLADACRLLVEVNVRFAFGMLAESLELVRVCDAACSQPLVTRLAASLR